MSLRFCNQGMPSASSRSGLVLTACLVSCLLALGPSFPSAARGAARTAVAEAGPSRPASPYKLAWQYDTEG